MVLLDFRVQDRTGHSCLAGDLEKPRRSLRFEFGVLSSSSLHSCLPRGPCAHVVYWSLFRNFRAQANYSTLIETLQKPLQILSKNPKMDAATSGPKYILHGYLDP